MEKRLFDVVFSSIFLMFFSPFLIFFSILIYLNDRGPVFYRGVRVGRNGVKFRIFKFRSMVMNADKIGGSSTSDDDPRITRIGNFLRKYKIDEIPQLLNVLNGEMSLVGPRPEVEYYVSLYTDEERAILSVRPGITDWATLWNSDEGMILAGSPDPEKTYMELIRPEKIRLQLGYVKNRTFWVDIKILVMTVAGIILCKKPSALSALEEKKRMSD